MELTLTPPIWKNPERFKEHRERAWSRPENMDNLPPLLFWMQEILSTWWDTQQVTFSIPKELRKLFRDLTHHTDKKLNNDGSRRKRRDQGIKSLIDVAYYLLEYTNVQTDHNWLKFLEIARTKEHDTMIVGIAENSGLSESAVKDALILLNKLGFMKTRRRKHIKQDGDMVEIPACRYFTDKFFKCFGLSSMLKKHKRGYFEFERQKNNTEGQHQKKANQQATRTVDQVQKESEEIDQVYKKPEAPPTPPDKVPAFLKKKSFYKGF